MQFLFFNTNENFIDSDVTYYFDVETETWSQGPSMNYRRFTHGCVSFEGEEKVSSMVHLRVI